MLIFFLLISVTTLFGSECGTPVGGTHYPSMRFAVDRPSSSSSLSMSFESTHDPLLVHTAMLNPEEKKKADKLFYQGNKQGLQELEQKHLSWLNSFTFNVKEHKLAADYVGNLLERKELDLLVALHNAQQQEVKPILRMVFDTSKDPLAQAEAMVIADDKIGGIIGGYNSEFIIEPSRDEVTDMMVTTRFGTHAIDKLLPDPKKSAWQMQLCLRAPSFLH